MKTSEEEQFERIRLAVDADTGALDYWHSFTPQERIWALNLMNQRKYGYQTAPRVERVIEVLSLEQLRAESDEPQDSDSPATDQS
jgi:hypothetical protein